MRVVVLASESDEMSRRTRTYLASLLQAWSDGFCHCSTLCLGSVARPRSHGDSIASAAALAVVPAASNSLAATFPISLPTFIGIALRAAALAALAALISGCSYRLTTRAATSPFPVLRRHSIRG